MRRAAIRVGVASAISALTIFGVAAPAAAQEETFPACPGFNVSLDIGEDTRNVRKFTDRNGNPVTVLTGLANTVVVTNARTGESLTIPARGARTVITENPDDSLTFEYTGNLLLLLFPTDVGGPSTTLYAGRIIFTVSAEGVFEVQSASGRTTDICAELAG